MPENDLIRLDGAAAAREAGIRRLRAFGLGDVVIGVSPGAAFGSAKRWLPERFAESADRVAREIGRPSPCSDRSRSASCARP